MGQPHGCKSAENLIALALFHNVAKVLLSHLRFSCQQRLASLWLASTLRISVLPAKLKVKGIFLTSTEETSIIYRHIQAWRQDPMLSEYHSTQYQHLLRL